VTETKKIAPPGLMRGARRRVAASQESLVETEPLRAAGPLPLVVRPAVKGVDLVAWAEAERPFIEEKVLAHGALLFRGFGIDDVDAFERFTAAASGSLIEYKERSSPRSDVGDKVYTSTDYPAEQEIFPHNEHSYSRVFPLKIFLGCLIPAETGGATPLVDCRELYRRIDPEVRRRFEEKGYMYVRNFGDGFGLPWQTVFQTEDRDAVEAYCVKAGIQCEWKDDSHLRTRQVRPAVARHPKSGEELWFNHLTFFHVSTLAPSIRQALLAEYAEEDLPNHTYYGDGTPIEPQVIAHLQQTYVDQMIRFEWQKGDVVLVDNMLTAHARDSFSGPRKVVFAMAEPITRNDF